MFKDAACGFRRLKGWVDRFLKELPNREGGQIMVAIMVFV